MPLTAQDRTYLKQALDEARRCIPTPTAYCVGCVIVDAATQTILSTGFSRELAGNTHAEECALAKLKPKVETKDRELKALDMYATMEPCSERLSGNKPCTDRILESGHHWEGGVGCKGTGYICQVCWGGKVACPWDCGGSE